MGRVRVCSLNLLIFLQNYMDCLLNFIIYDAGGRPTKLMVRVTAEGKTFESNSVEVPNEPPVWNFRLIFHRIPQGKPFIVEVRPLDTVRHNFPHRH